MASSYIAWYLFLAGAGGGAFVIGAVVDLALRFKDPACLARVSSVTDAGLVAGPALVALGSVFLVLDLGAPERAFAVFLSPVTSVLGFGAWSVAVFCFAAVGALVMGIVQDTRTGRAVEFVLQVVAMAAALCVIGYSGVFLSLWPAVPFLNTPFVPVLFTASALATGAAVLIVVAVAGIAGYTLIYSSYGLSLTAHEPFTSAEDAVATERDIVSNRVAVRYNPRRALVGDTDNGKALKERIQELKQLLEAYRKGVIKEKK